MFPLFSANYVDNYWIKDRTFFSDMKLGLENAALGMELSGLHNWQIKPFNTTNFYDTNSLFTQFFTMAAQNAQIMTQNMFCGLPGMNFQFPTLPGVATPEVSGTKEKPEKEAKEDLTDEQKEQFDNLKEEFNNLYDSYNELDDATKKALGLDGILKTAKRAYDSKNNNKPESMQKCINDLKTAIDEISNKNLVKILDKVKPDAIERDTRVEPLYNKDTDKELIKGLVYGDGTGVPVITKDNIILELDTTMGTRGGKSIVRVLTEHEDADDKELVESVTFISNALLDRASKEDVKDAKGVIKAKGELAAALEKYKDEVDAENKKAIVDAFENLYKEIKLELARKQDETNLEKIEDLPDELKAKYVDENGNLKEEFRINEKETINFLNGIKKDWVQASEIKTSGFSNITTFANITEPEKADEGEQEDDKEADKGKEATDSKPNFFTRTWNKVCEFFSTLGNMETNTDVCDPSFFHIKRQ